jgi:serine/threonine-protein kinase RsbW
VAPSTHPSDGPCAWTRKTLPTRLDVIRATEAEILDRMKALGYDEDRCFAVRLAFEEALVNAMKHGNAMNPARRVRLRYRVLADRVEIHVCDEGRGFNPCKVPDPTSEENLHKPCGRGIMLMRSYMDKVSYGGSGREVHMVKYRGS